MGGFPTTRWSLILAGRDDPAASRSALEHLCRAYRTPVLAYIRRRSSRPAEAEDLTQAFFTALIERRIEDVADPAKGRFRALLLTALVRWLANAEEQRCALRRGGGQVHADIDEQTALADAGDPDPEGAFLRDWALTVLKRAMAALRREALAAGKAELFDALRDSLIESPDAEDYVRIGEHFGMRRNTVAVAVHRLRQRLRACVRAELADTVARSEDVDAEMEALRVALGGVLRESKGRPGVEEAL
jgi:RNA polymerase sigma-70 factor (ECF subfamily)